MEGENKKNNVVVGVVVVVVVVLIAIFAITSNKKAPAENNSPEQNNVMAEEVSLADGGVKYVVLQEGTGEGAYAGQRLSMNYTGKLMDGTVFDSNIDPAFGHAEPFNFVLGRGEVIQGWEIGTEGMKVGEKRMLTIAPQYAYGETGAGSIIGPNSTLQFEIELLSIQ